MADDEELLDRINAVQVGTDDLLDLAAARDEYREQHPDREDEGIAAQAGEPESRQRRFPDSGSGPRTWDQEIWPLDK